MHASLCSNRSYLAAIWRSSSLDPWLAPDSVQCCHSYHKRCHKTYTVVCTSASISASFYPYSVAFAGRRRLLWSNLQSPDHATSCISPLFSCRVEELELPSSSTLPSLLRDVTLVWTTFIMPAPDILRSRFSSEASMTVSLTTNGPICCPLTPAPAPAPPCDFDRCFP